MVSIGPPAMPDNPVKKDGTRKIIEKMTEDMIRCVVEGRDYHESVVIPVEVTHRIGGVETKSILERKAVFILKVKRNSRL